MTFQWDLEIPVVAADHFGVWCPNGVPKSVHHNLQEVLIHFHLNAGHTLIRQKEDDGKQSHLKLWADAYETAAHWLDQTIPAELQV